MNVDRFDNDKLPQRTLKAVAWLGVLSVLMALSMTKTAVALGLAVGVGLGLFSLWSLTEGVPRLLQDGKSGQRVMLGIMLLLKLPLYAVVLWWCTSDPRVSPFAVFAGVGYVPAVITLKILGQQLAGAPAKK